MYERRKFEAGGSTRFRAGRDKRKENGRVFSLENVPRRFEAVSGKRGMYARV